MFWVVDNFLMHKKKSCEDEDNIRAKFIRRDNTTNTEEVEVLLNSNVFSDNDHLINRNPNGIV